MFNYRLLLVILFVFIITTLLADDFTAEQKEARDALSGWNKATWGMTDKQVHEAFGDEANVLDKPDKFDFSKSSGGGTYLAPIGIDNYEIGPMKCKVRFLFKNSESMLSVVVITSYEKEPISLKHQFTEIEKLLIEKYGKESHKTHSSNNKVNTWAFSNSIIELEFSYIKNILSLLTITYRKSTSEKEKSKL